MRPVCKQASQFPEVPYVYNILSTPLRKKSDNLVTHDEISKMTIDGVVCREFNFKIKSQLLWCQFKNALVMHLGGKIVDVPFIRVE